MNVNLSNALAQPSKYVGAHRANVTQWLLSIICSILLVLASPTASLSKTWKPDKRITPALKNATALSKDIAADLKEYLKPLQDKRNELDSAVIWVVMDPKLDAKRLANLDSAVQNIQKLGKALKYLAYVGIAVDLITSFLPNGGDPTLNAITKVSDQIQTLSDRIDSQFEHTNDLIEVTALKQTVKTAISKINSDADQLDGYSEQLSKFKANKALVLTYRAMSDLPDAIKPKTKIKEMDFPEPTGVVGIKPDVIASRAAIIGDTCTDLFSKLMDETYGDYESLNMMGIYVLASLMNANRSYMSSYVYQAAIAKKDREKSLDDFLRPTQATVDTASDNAEKFVGKHFQNCSNAFRDARAKLRNEYALKTYVKRYLTLRLDDIANVEKPARRITAELQRLHPKHDWTALIYTTPKKAKFHTGKGKSTVVMPFPSDKSKTVLVNFIERDRKIERFHWWNRCGSRYTQFPHYIQDKDIDKDVYVFQNVGFSFKRWHFRVDTIVDLLDKICSYEDATSYTWVGLRRYVKLNSKKKLKSSVFFTTNKEAVDIRVGQEFAVLTVLQNRPVYSSGRWISDLPKFVLGEDNRFGPLDDQYADTKPISCKQNKPIGGIRFVKGGNRLFMAVECPKEWRSNKKVKSDSNYFGPLGNQYADTRAVQCERGKIVSEISFYKRGNRLTPRLVCATPDKKVKETVNSSWKNSYSEVLEDLYVDKTSQTCPRNTFVAGFQFQQHENRLVPRVLCRRLYD